MLSTFSVNNPLAESKGVYERIILERIQKLHKFIDAMKRGVRIRLTYRKYGADLALK